MVIEYCTTILNHLCEFMAEQFSSLGYEPSRAEDCCTNQINGHKIHKFLLWPKCSIGFEVLSSNGKWSHQLFCEASMISPILQTKYNNH